ncbi:CAP domain-containing protein [Jiangella alba]|uniref:CAP domain-containing protein n=1 Tax=Jiangella alba TaxID=561176 RepID=UPI00083EBB0A|nr:CAP domain-containing protein [Jiangella alba]
MPLLARVGVVLLVGSLAIAGIILAITDGPPVLHARADGGARVDDFTTGETPTPDTGTTPSDSPTEPGETPSPSGSETPSPDESDDGSGGSGDDSSGQDAEDSDDHLVATTPPREPDTPQPSEPTDEPSDEPSEEPSTEPSDEPTDEPPSDDPTIQPPDQPTEEPTPHYPELPLLDLSRSEAQLLDSAEQARADAGCPDLRIDPRLTTAAREHSADMRDRFYYSHVNPDGQTPEDRAAAVGYTASVGENLARGLRNAQQVVRDWDGEERDRLLDCSYTSVGLGVERGLLNSWWTLMLGTD